MKAPYLLLSTPADRDQMVKALEHAGIGIAAPMTGRATYPRMWHFSQMQGRAGPSVFTRPADLITHLKTVGALKRYTPVNSIAHFISSVRALRSKVR